MAEWRKHSWDKRSEQIAISKTNISEESESDLLQEPTRLTSWRCTKETAAFPGKRVIIGPPIECCLRFPAANENFRKKMRKNAKKCSYFANFFAKKNSAKPISVVAATTKCAKKLSIRSFLDHIW